MSEKIITITLKDKKLMRLPSVKKWLTHVEEKMEAELPRMEKHRFNMSVFGMCDGSCEWILHGGKNV